MRVDALQVRRQQFEVVLFALVLIAVQRTAKAADAVRRVGGRIQCIRLGPTGGIDTQHAHRPDPVLHEGALRAGHARTACQLFKHQVGIAFCIERWPLQGIGVHQGCDLHACHGAPLLEGTLDAAPSPVSPVGCANQQPASRQVVLLQGDIEDHHDFRWRDVVRRGAPGFTQNFWIVNGCAGRHGQREDGTADPFGGGFHVDSALMIAGIPRGHTRARWCGLPEPLCSLAA